MKQVLFDRSGTVHVNEVPAPRCAADRVLIRAAHSVISTGTETSEYARGGLASEVADDPKLISKVWNRAREAGLRQTIEQVRERLNERTPRGYAGSGVVLDVGEDISDLRPGDRVAYGGEPHADIVSAKPSLVARVPDGAALDQAAATTIASISLHGLRLAEVGIGESVVVIGLGLVGQICVALGRAMGLRVAGVDLIAQRISLASDLGLDLALPASSPAEAVRAVLDWTDGLGADSALVCAGSESSAPTRLACELARDRGHVIVIGASGLHLERPPLYGKELVFRVSRSYGPGRYDPLYEDRGVDYPAGFVRWTENRNFKAVLDLLERGTLDLAPLLSEHFPIERAPEAYAALKRGDDAPLTAVLDYAASETGQAIREETRRVRLRTVPRGRETAIDIGLIGCGAFARSQILPALRRAGNFRVRAVAAATGLSATNVARLANAGYCTTEYQQILDDPEIDAVVIATRHDLHVPIALAAARAGKPFHVEKPLALCAEDARQVEAAVASADLLAAIGFNRRSAPFIRDLKQWVDQRQGPVELLIRVNAPPLPADHWALDRREGGGRLVGEGCHFVDLANYLVGSPGRVVAAATLGVDSLDDRESNLSLLIRSEDGSRATLSYGSIGHRALPKERIEVSWDGHSVVIDDFRQMHCLGIGRSRKVRRADKGVQHHFANFSSALRGEADLVAPISAGVVTSELIEEAQGLMRRENGP